MTGPLVLAIDQGTTNTKAILLNAAGAIVARGAAPVGIAHPRPGWVEQDPEDIWRSVEAAVAACLGAAPGAVPAAVGISNQRESVVLWDRASGTPLGPAITWQCRRTSEEVQRLKADGAGSDVLERTGLPLDPLFPALKIRWLLDRAGRSGGVCAGTIDSWLIWKLSGGTVHATDLSNASRTQLLNVRDGTWDATLCALFRVPREILPEVHDSSHVFAETVAAGPFPAGLPVAAAIGDSHAALFGHVATRPGDAKVTFGTGSSVMASIPVFRAPRDGLTTTVAFAVGGRSTYAYEGNILVSASLFPWVARLLGCEGDVEQLMRMAAAEQDSGGVALVPAMVGLGAPYWEPQARGLISGLTFGVTPERIARAAAESMAFQVLDVIEAIGAQSPVPLGRLFVDGGPSRNGFLMQLVADILDHPLEVSEAPDISALGAGYLAGLATGVWTGAAALEALPRKRQHVQPAMRAERRNEAVGLWRDAVARCRVRTDG